MLTYVHQRFSDWEHLGVIESETGSRLVAHTPRDFPQAYLHRYFAPVPTSAWDGYPIKLPDQLSSLYAVCNGLSLFGGALSLWGMRAHYSRDSSAQFQPFDLAAHHNEWLQASQRQGVKPRQGTTFFGSYSWDGSGIYVVEGRSDVYRSLKGSPEPVSMWSDLAFFINSEYDRLAGLFSRSGYQFDDNIPTVPGRAP